MIQSVAQGGMAEADASHWVGPGATEHGVPLPVGVGDVERVVGTLDPEPDPPPPGPEPVQVGAG